LATYTRSEVGSRSS